MTTSNLTERAAGERNLHNQRMEVADFSQSPFTIAWEVTQEHVADSLLLPDAAIREAQLALWKEFKLAVEPAAALGLAALQTGAYRPAADEKVCLVLCGANLDPATLS